MEIVYEQNTSCSVMIRSCGYRTVNIKTIIIKKHYWFFGFEWDSYHIKQYIPYNNDPFYDGEYNSNKELYILATQDRHNAEYEILKLKSKA